MLCVYAFRDDREAFFISPIECWNADCDMVGKKFRESVDTVEANA